jgi:hypothetical protein
MFDLREITRKFLMNESKEDYSVQFHIRAISEALKSVEPKNQKQQRKLYEALEHLKQVKRKNRLLEEKFRVSRRGSKYS